MKVKANFEEALRSAAVAVLLCLIPASAAAQAERVDGYIKAEM